MLILSSQNVEDVNDAQHASPDRGVNRCANGAARVATPRSVPATAAGHTQLVEVSTRATALQRFVCDPGKAEGRASYPTFCCVLVVSVLFQIELLTRPGSQLSPNFSAVDDTFSGCSNAAFDLLGDLILLGCQSIQGRPILIVDHKV